MTLNLIALDEPHDSALAGLALLRAVVTSLEAISADASDAPDFLDALHTQGFRIVPQERAT
jgi:hypothetical protein